MAKGKNLNPADAQRKAERKKELKKNKTERQKTRDFALVKKDTSSLEEEIQRLEKAEIDQTITPSQRTQLPSLRDELKRINKKKDDYVAEHPEHRRLVYRGRRSKPEEPDGVEDDGKNKERKVFDKNGIPRHPERSVYYDPVMNPFGVPPPGMPYMERPLRPDEVDSQAEDDSDEEGVLDDDITMPSGPPPPPKDAHAERSNDGEGDEDSDDDIPMPEGPPPSQVQPPLPPLPPPNIIAHPYLNASMSLPPNFQPRPPSGYPGAPPMDFAPPVSGGFSYPSVPPPPPGFPSMPLPPPPGFPPPPPGFPPNPAGRTPLPSRSRVQSDASIQDPLSSMPHQTFQAYRENQGQITHPLPDKPIGVPGPSSSTPAQPAVASNASTISAPAQLRDLKKESTAFMPSSLKRKKPGGTAGSSSALPAGNRINAAPAADHAGDEDATGETEAPARPDLLGALQSSFPALPPKQDAGEGVSKKRRLDLPDAKKGKDDYEKFMEEIGDIL